MSFSEILNKNDIKIKKGKSFSKKMQNRSYGQFRAIDNIFERRRKGFYKLVSKNEKIGVGSLWMKIG